MSRLPYHLRMSLGVLALMVFAAKTITFASHSRQLTAKPEGKIQPIVDTAFFAYHAQ